MKFILIGLMLGFSAQTMAFGTFGFSGADGADGSYGRDGAFGRDVTFRADGSFLDHDLSGDHGTYGQDGTIGGDAYNCVQRRPRHNLIGASGGNGGDGGRGGDGGNGGDATIYFKKYKALKKVVVNAMPGEGSEGGYGQAGGYGCACEKYRWKKRFKETRYRSKTKNKCRMKEVCDDNGENCKEKRVCKDVTVQVPYEHVYFKRFTCTDGANGTHGSDAGKGSRGSYGKVTLIKKGSKLRPTRPSVTMKLQELLEPVLLSRQMWETKSGANGLLGSGSAVSDTYSFWLGRLEKSILFNYNVARKPLSYFAKQNISLKLGDSISFNMPGNLWYSYKVKNEGDLKIVSLNQALYKSEAEKIKPVKIHIDGKKTTMTIVDNGGVSNFVKTRFYIEAAWTRTDGGGRGALKRWKDYIPQNLITRSGNTYTIDLGKLPIKTKYFKKRRTIKKRVNMDLTIHRSFNGFKTQVGTFDIYKKQGKDLKVKLK